MQFYACVCISATLVQYNPMLAYVCPSCFAQCLCNNKSKCALGDDYGPGLLSCLCGPYLMEEHNHKHFKSLPRSLHIAYDFSNTLKIHLNPHWQWPFYKRLASLITSKHAASYSATMRMIRCKISFSLINSAVMCLGAWSSFRKPMRALHLIDTPVDLIVNKGCFWSN